MDLCKECKKEILEEINNRKKEIKYIMKLTNIKESDYITALENLKEKIGRNE
jgi:hypothetical protein